MLAMHAHAGFGMAAHDIHYAIVGGGLLGLVALLSPRFLTPHGPADEHEARVLALRASLAGHDHRRPPGLATGNQPATALDPTQVAAPGRLLRTPALTTAQRVLLPLAVVSSASSAAAHTAVGPQHLRESVWFGVFFACCAMLQLLWAALVAVHGTWQIVAAGAVGNLGVIGLWAVTRSMGLPFGLMPRPESVGPWDLACAVWELVVVGACVALVQSRDPLPTRLVTWRSWHPALPTYVAACLLLLTALAASGTGA